MKRVREGLAEIEVGEGVFYNPRASLNRSLAVLFLETYYSGRGDVTFLDSHAGTGIRGIRYLLEVGPVEYGYFVDASPRSYEAVVRNVSLNRLADRASVYMGDARALPTLLGGLEIDVVDIDPFGSPLPYLHSGLMVFGRRGLLVFTATDLMTLCEVVEGGVERIYGSAYSRNDVCHELAIRILVREGVLAAVRMGFSARPLLSTFENNYVRVYLEVDRRRSLLRHDYLGFLVYNEGMGWAPVSLSDAGREGLPDGRVVGPLWIGPYIDTGLVSRIVEEARGDRWRYLGREVQRFLARLGEEDTSIVGLYRLSKLCKEVGKPMPSMSRLRDAITSSGYRFSRTHIYPDGFRTDAPPSFLVDMISSLV